MKTIKPDENYKTRWKPNGHMQQHMLCASVNVHCTSYTVH